MQDDIPEFTGADLKRAVLVCKICGPFCVPTSPNGPDLNHTPSNRPQT
jgi:hypothetical protein